MFESYLNNLYSMFTATKYELIVLILIFIIIFAVVFDVIFRILKFPRGITAIIAISISILAVFTGITTKAMYFIFSLGITSAIVIIAMLVIIAFILFALSHLGITHGRGIRGLRRR